MTSPKPLPASPRRAPTGDEVAAFLRRHPDFLARNPELVEVLRPPEREAEGNVVDMQHFMIERLQTRLGDLTDDHQSLVETTRGNLLSQARVHAAVLEILNARSFEHFVHAITSDVAMHLDLDVVALCVEREPADRPANTPPPRTGIRFLRDGEIDRYINEGEPVALRTGIKAERRIYGPGAALVRSDALLRLSISEDAPRGLLALGSREPEAFADDQNMVLLEFLTRVIESTARAWLHLPG